MQSRINNDRGIEMSDKKPVWSTVYNAVILPDYLPKMTTLFETFGDIVVRPRFDRIEIEKATDTVKEKITKRGFETDAIIIAEFTTRLPSNTTRESDLLSQVRSISIVYHVKSRLNYAINPATTPLKCDVFNHTSNRENDNVQYNMANDV
jgi:hypothetical protein